MTTNNPQGLKINKPGTYTEEEMKAAFPDVDPAFVPLGNRVLVQLRSARTVSRGGIILTGDTTETEKWNTQVAKVRAIGQLAFRNNTTLEPWPEGDWCKIGDFVRIPKFLQDKWEIKFDDHDVLFMLVSDTSILAKCTGNPLDVKAYI